MFDFKIPVGVIPDNITSDLQNMTSLQEAVDNILDLGNKDGDGTYQDGPNVEHPRMQVLNSQPRPINLPLSKRWMQVSWATILPPLASIDVKIYRF